MDKNLSHIPPLKYLGLTLSTGFAIFAMFFGSGNLVFPLILGAIAENNYGVASLGLVVTGVCLPFLGLLGILLFEGDMERFFGQFGRASAFLIPLLMISLLGPFGVVPRCITVAWGSSVEIFGPSPALIFNGLSCLLIFLCCLFYNRIVPLIGSFLTPFLLLSLGIIVGVGLFQSADPMEGTLEKWDVLKEGVANGYQTMDLLAAFFFAQIAMIHIHHRLKPYDTLENFSQIKFKITLIACCIGAGLLGLIYLAFVYLGASYSDLLQGAPEKYLTKIAYHSLGTKAAPVIGLAVILACLTTAIALTTAFAKFLKERMAFNRLSFRASLIITLIISFLVAALEFKGISAFLAPILEFLYPGLILITCYNVGKKLIDPDQPVPIVMEN